MERIFIGIACSPEIQRSFERLRMPLEGARWVHPQDYHLTLTFIGEIQTVQTHELANALEELNFTSFTLRPRRVDVFGPMERPKALFVGVSGDEYLGQLQEMVVQQVHRCLPEIERDKRRFQPHITLARFSAALAGTGGELGTYLEANSLYQGPDFEVQSFGLFRSRSKPDDGGPRYQLIQSFELH